MQVIQYFENVKRKKKKKKKKGLKLKIRKEI